MLVVWLWWMEVGSIWVRMSCVLCRAVPKLGEEIIWV